MIIIWDLKIIGKDAPDIISIDINIGSTFFAGGSMTYSINLLTRGKPGVSITATEQERFGGEINWGVNLNVGYYMGNPLDIRNSSVAGPIKSFSGDIIGGGQVYFGYDETGRHVWTGFGVGIGFSGGGSYGFGRTRIIWPNN